MIHYTCDRCHREIDTEVEVRYAVQVECRAVFECGAHVEPNQEEDHLLELHEVLERMEDEPEPVRAAKTQSHHFDLCSDCYKVYSRNPLARETPLSIEFSEN